MLRLIPISSNASAGLKNQTPSELNLRAEDPASLIDGWYVPDEIEVQGSNLLWRYESCHLIEPDRAALRDMLICFSGLATASDQAIVEFARQWGRLGICQHGRPIGHLTHRGEAENLFIEYGCPPRERGGRFCESLEKWRDYAQQVRSILALAVACRRAIPKKIDYTKIQESTLQRPGNTEDWDTAKREWQIDNPGSEVHATEPVTGGRTMLSLIITHWLTFARFLSGMTGDRTLA